MGKGAYVLLCKMDMGLPTTYYCTAFFSAVSRLLTKGYMKQGRVLCCVEHPGFSLHQLNMPTTPKHGVVGIGICQGDVDSLTGRAQDLTGLAQGTTPAYTRTKTIELELGKLTASGLML